MICSICKRRTPIRTAVLFNRLRKKRETVRLCEVCAKNMHLGSKATKRGSGRSVNYYKQTK